MVFGFINYFSHAGLFYNISLVITFLIGVSVLSKDDLNPVYKIMWICILSMLPVIGAIIYLLWGDRKITKRHASQMLNVSSKCKAAMEEYKHFFVDPENLSGGEKASAKYLLKYADAPVFGNTQSEYLPNGETFFERLKTELEKAEKFIFLEYFIIKNGVMWSQTYDILKRKASEGVDVRIIYDAIGSFFDMPEDFQTNCTNDGIKCHSFNPIRFTAKISDYTFLNHRDHRKICVIDGNTGFTGGINFGDEYINLASRCGYWKDTAVMLKGYGVFSLTISFLKMWEYVSGDTNGDYCKFLPEKGEEADFYVQPYEDTPADIENVSENSYFNVIHHARNYVYITTPYLIIDHEMFVGLSVAAKSGVDVRIVVPGIPDKKYAFYITQSYYPELLKSGVRIYEYTPGFMHAKMFVRDNEQAIVGTANMDYRSLYLHFENCCAFYGGNVVSEVKKDLDEIISQSREITLETVAETSKIKRLIQVFLKFIAPLM